MKKKIIGYKAISNAYPQIEAEIYKEIQAGWQPFGSPVLDREEIIQAMVKYEA